MKPIDVEIKTQAFDRPLATQPDHNRGTRIWLRVALFLAIGSLVIGIGLPGPQLAVYFAAIGIGFTFAAAGVVAIWIAFESVHIAWRLMFGLATMIAISLAFGWYVERTDGPSSVAIAGIACLWGQSLLTQLPLWILRAIGGWQLTHKSLDNSGSRRTQFGIGTMLIATAIVCVLLAVGRFAAPFVADFNPERDRGLTWLGLFATIGFGNSLITLCLLWIFACRHWGMRLLSGFVLVVIIGLAAFAEGAQIHLVAPNSIWEAAVPFAVCLNGFSLGMTGLLLTALNIAGRRIRQLPKA